MRTLAFVQKSQRESIYANVIHAGSRGEYCENAHNRNDEKSKDIILLSMHYTRAMHR